jgi:hypothetical protein
MGWTDDPDPEFWLERRQLSGVSNACRVEPGFANARVRYDEHFAFNEIVYVTIVCECTVGVPNESKHLSVFHVSEYIMRIRHLQLRFETHHAIDDPLRFPLHSAQKILASRNILRFRSSNATLLHKSDSLL